MQRCFCIREIIQCIFPRDADAHSLTHPTFFFLRSDPTSRRLEQDINQRERFKVELEEISNKIISLADPAATAADKVGAV